MKTSEVANSYAKALLAVTKQNGAHLKALAELKVMAGVLSDADFINYFENKMISPDQKAAVITNAVKDKGLSQEVTNVLVMMAERNRIGFVTEVVEALQAAIDVEQGVTRGVVRSAQPLTAEAKSELEAKIAKVLDKKIVLSYQQDNKLLGGVVAEVGGWTFDDSIDTHLKKLNEELNRRAN